jgi:hypothetical protein
MHLDIHMHYALQRGPIALCIPLQVAMRIRNAKKMGGERMCNLDYPRSECISHRRLLLAPCASRHTATAPAPTTAAAARRLEDEEEDGEAVVEDCLLPDENILIHTRGVPVGT